MGIDVINPLLFENYHHAGKVYVFEFKDDRVRASVANIEDGKYLRSFEYHFEISDGGEGFMSPERGDRLRKGWRVSLLSSFGRSPELVAKILEKEVHAD
jgi:hypothetical protein